MRSGTELSQFLRISYLLMLSTIIYVVISAEFMEAKFQNTKLLSIACRDSTLNDTYLDYRKRYQQFINITNLLIMLFS